MPMAFSPSQYVQHPQQGQYHHQQHHQQQEYDHSSSLNHDQLLQQSQLNSNGSSEQDSSVSLRHIGSNNNQEMHMNTQITMENSGPQGPNMAAINKQMANREQDEVKRQEDAYYGIGNGNGNGNGNDWDTAGIKQLRRKCKAYGTEDYIDIFIQNGVDSWDDFINRDEQGFKILYESALKKDKSKIQHVIKMIKKESVGVDYMKIFGRGVQVAIVENNDDDDDGLNSKLKQHCLSRYNKEFKRNGIKSLKNLRDLDERQIQSLEQKVIGNVKFKNKQFEKLIRDVTSIKNYCTVYNYHTRKKNQQTYQQAQQQRITQQQQQGKIQGKVYSIGSSVVDSDYHVFWPSMPSAYRDGGQ